MDKKEIKKILMTRDGITEQEAEDLIQDTQDEFNELMEDDNPSICAADDILSCNLGLEPDYMEAFIGIG